MAQKNTPHAGYSRAIIQRKLEFKSLQAQRVMHRSFNKLQQSVFSVSVILKIISDDEDEIAKIDDYIDEHFIETEKEMVLEQNRIRQILDDNGIEETATYSKPKVYEVQLDSPRANTFLRLVGHLDALILLIDTAWLCGELTDKQKKQTSFQWQQRLIKLAARIMGLEKRARIAAFNQGKADEVEAQAPVDTSENDAEMDAEMDAEATASMTDEIPLLDQSNSAPAASSA
ncbi:MAG: hypothetical protein KTR20_00985 [Cellvibrionaceae bacterium]|nr:hypothetical protein [Cellvibrionaceae bacterium]